ncbi:[protein-PII] uridylyltransferase [Rhodopirellula sp. MGV]|uniref:[protein-PII] uridylyltransferase n=1 Tax=Rhodopirellula sp. MGV TaxID=2023130 RepID=UPI000B966F76|nr:[protein-PII] uridylyltransferase [Rhodopirellula sp. MGV]OYP31028.1 [protein-PII] uridylyltransferase [Rhodopirellula sp. MGV]PNY34624.1 [protein-PII] uridylyltransferase [Rhodopirellula baltica]
MAGPSLSEVVLSGREHLREGRERCRRVHVQGGHGIQVSTLVSDLYDDIVMEVFHQACRDHFDGEIPSGLALVAHGGFGRRDLAPYSDADLMLITRSRNTAAAERIAQSLTRDLVDIGIDVGFALRTTREACSLSWSDPVIFTSLTESRFLAGSVKVFTRFFQSLRHGAYLRRARLIRDLIQARREERTKWGVTSYLLTPNVKKSRGGLRDIQMVRWIGFARYGEVDLEKLLRLNTLSREDYRLLRKAYDFLIRLRNELHFRENKAQDILSRATQLEIAESWNYDGDDGVLPVEVFMQQYFEVTRSVRYISGFFADDNRSRPWTEQVYEWVASRRIDQSIRMGPTHIWVDQPALREFAQSLPRVLRLMSVANHNNRRIGHYTWQAIRIAMQERDPAPPDSESVGAFLSLLSRGSRLAPLLRRLHELRIIEQLIPEFKRTRGLLQFNAYHKYTVDAHSIRAVEAATDFADDQSSMGRRYRRLKDKTLLHLALLIHDIGKGYSEDHSIVGARIARKVGERFDLDTNSIEILEWLVLKHLAVNNVAFRHDLNDTEIVLSFAKEVGSIRRLELLIVHAVADLAAVGPGVLTDWKMKLIEDLYLRTRRYFETGDVDLDHEALAEEIRLQVGECLTDSDPESTSHSLLRQLPLSMLRREKPDVLAKQIDQVAESLDQGNTSYCFHHYDPIPSASRYVVIHRQGQQRVGIFARVAGAFMSCGISILRAEIVTLDDLVWDEFWVNDRDHSEHPPDSRINEVSERVTHLLDSPDVPVPPRRQKWTMAKSKEPEKVNVLPSKVDFDNETLDRFTILSFFAYDQTGLLYKIASALSEMGLVIHFAKIDTHLDQVADVFYVTEIDGGKVEHEQRKQEIRGVLLGIAEEREQD